jgi:hypothetical protein
VEIKIQFSLNLASIAKLNQTIYKQCPMASVKSKTAVDTIKNTEIHDEFQAPI